MLWVRRGKKVCSPSSSWHMHSLYDGLWWSVWSWSSNLQTSHLPSGLVILALCPSVFQENHIIWNPSSQKHPPSQYIWSYLGAFGSGPVLYWSVTSLAFTKQTIIVSMVSLSSCLRVAPSWGGEHNCRWIKKYTVQKTMSISMLFLQLPVDL